LAGPATPGQYAQAGPPTAPQPIGRVETVAGSATAVRNGVAIELNVGDLVFQGDVVQTLSNAALAIAFSDGSAFTLNENARMALNEFVYDPNSTSNSALINLVQGTVSFIAAQVAKTGTMRVDTPTATLGIRGTFITLSVSSVDGHTVASLGLESHPVTGEQFAGAFTLTNRITGNQVLVSQINSIFSVSPAGTMSESPKPAEIHALEQATFQALVPVMQAAANLGGQTGPAQGQNPNQNPNQNPAQDGQQGQKSDSSPGPSPGGSGGANPAPDNKPPADNHVTAPSPTTLVDTPLAGNTGPTTTISITTSPTTTIPITPSPPTTSPTTTSPTTTTPTTTTPGDNPASPHITPVTDVTVTDTDDAPNDAPVALDDAAAVKEDAQPNPVSGNLLTNDTDVDTGDTHRVSALSGGADNGTTLTKVGAYGTLVITKATGAYTYTLANSQANVQALADGQQVTDVFTYTNSDNHGGSSASTLTVTVRGSNDSPVAVADTAAVKEETNTEAQPNSVSGNVLANDTDVDTGDTHRVSALSGGTDNGTTFTKVGTYGTLVITKATGAYTYTLANGQANVQALADGQHVTDVFTYTNADNHGGSNGSTLTVTVTGSNDAPVAMADAATATEDALPNTVNGNVLTNDTDVDSLDTHSVSALSGGTDNGTTLTKVGTYGTLVITKATGGYTYTLANGQANVQALAQGDHVTDVFTYTNSDNHGGSSSATLTVTVSGTDEESLQETNWIAEGNGDWDVPTNWSNGVPSSTVAAVIALASTVTINSSITAQAYSLTVSAAGKINLNGGTLQAGSISLGSGTFLEGHGTVSGPITNDGLIKSFSSHTLKITGDITGTAGSMEIQNHATLELDGSAAATQTLSFEGGEGVTGTLILDHSLTEPFNAVISGLVDEDQRIDLKDLTFTSSEDMQAETSYSETTGYTTLEVTKISTNQSVTFTLAGDYTNPFLHTWHFVQDSGTGTIFYDPPAALESTVTAALTTQDASADQFTFQSDSQSDTLTDPTLVASADPNATDAATADATPDSFGDTSPIAITDTALSINETTSTPPATSDPTQGSTMTQTAAVAPAAASSTGDTFVFAANFGNVTLTNFHPDTDVIEIDHTVFADFQALLAAAHDDGSGNAVISADPHDTITIKNVTVAQLVQYQGDFHFA
jgi:VCBS repeat-containing protein